MNYTWVVLGFFTYAFHSFFTLRFANSILKYSKISALLNLTFALLNAGIFTAAYFWGLPYFTLYIFSYIAYFLEFNIISKAGLRQVWFAVSGFLLNIVAVHLIVVVITAYVMGTNILAVYTNNELFYKTVVVSHLMLFIIMKLAEFCIPKNKLVDISTAKIYSEIMSITTTILITFVVYDSYIFTNVIADTELFVSMFSTTIFVVVLFYCLFLFNTFLIDLHPYKRKADEAKSLHGKVIQKKILTEYKLYIDDLTKLYNRRFIDHKIDELCESKKSKFGLIYADLFALKHVNDTYGHRSGDRYIVNVAQAMKRAVREEDFPARIGGDEFLIVLEDITESDMLRVVERIRALVEKQDKQEEFRVHANLGFMCFDTEHSAQTRVELMGKVDILMKKDKESFYKKGGG